MLQIRILAFGCILGLISFTTLADVKTVRHLIKSDSIDLSQTCLDEYMSRRNHLWVAAGLGLPLAPVDVVGGGFAGAGVGYGVQVVTGSALVGIVEPVMLGVYGGWLAGIALAVGWEMASAVKLVQNGFLINVIAASREGNMVDASLKKFHKKYLRSYKQDRDTVTPERLAQVMSSADQSGQLCDGSLTKSKRHSLRHRLASKKDIFRFVHRQIDR